jgi:type III pantothenate kinase
MIDGLVEGIKGEMVTSPEEEFKVIATGGMANLIAPYANSIDLIEPKLTLYGLQIIYNRLVQR